MRFHQFFVVYTSRTYTYRGLPTWTLLRFVVSTGNTSVNVGAGIYV